MTSTSSSHYPPVLQAVHDFFYDTAETLYTAASDTYHNLSDWNSRRRGAPILSLEWINEALRTDSRSLLISISESMIWRLKSFDYFFPGVSETIEQLRGSCDTPTVIGSHEGTLIYWMDSLSRSNSSNIQGVVFCYNGSFHPSRNVPEIRITAYGQSLRQSEDMKLHLSASPYNPYAGLDLPSDFPLPLPTLTPFPESLWGGHLLDVYNIPSPTNLNIVGLYVTPQVEKELRTLVSAGWLGSLPRTYPLPLMVFPDQYDDIFSVVTSFRRQEGTPTYSTLYLVNPPEEPFSHIQDDVEGLVFVNLEQPTLNLAAYEGTTLSNYHSSVLSKEFPLTSAPPLLVPPTLLKEVGAI